MKNKILGIYRHPLFSGSAVMIIGTNLGNFFAYLYHLIIGRMLGPVGYGELASIISLVGFFSITFGFLGLVIVKFVSQMKNDEVPAFFLWVSKRAILAAAVISFTVFAASRFLGGFLNVSLGSAMFVGPILFFLLTGMIFTSFLQGLLKFKELVISTVLGLLLRLLIGAALVYAGFAVFGALGAVLISSVLGLALAAYFLRGFWKMREQPFLFSKSNQIFSYAVPIFVMTVATNSMYTTDVVLAKHFFDPHLAGIYASLSTMGKIIFYGTAPISAVMFPLVSRTFARGGNYRKIFLLSALMTLAVVTGLLIIYRLFPSVVLRVLYGDKFLEGAPYLVWFGVFIALFAMASLTLNYFLSRGITKVVYIALGAAVVQVVGISFFHAGITQVISVSIAVSLILFLCLLIYFAYETYSKNGAGFNSDTGLQGRKVHR